MAAVPPMPLGPPPALTRAQHTLGHSIYRYTIPYTEAMNDNDEVKARAIKRRVMNAGEFTNDEWEHALNNPTGGRRKRKRRKSRRKTNKRKSRRRRKSSKRRRKPKRKTRRRRRRR